MLAILSLAGAALLLLVVFLVQPFSGHVPSLDRLFVGGAFISSSILGFTLAVRPGWFKRTTHTSNPPSSPDSRMENAPGRIGHHPDCGNFSRHVLRIGNRRRCAACTGLAGGSLLAIVLMSLYVIVPIELTFQVSLFLVLIGMFIVAVNQVDVVLPSRNPMVHSVLNAMLVLAFLSVVVGVLDITGNLVYGFFAIVISYLWLDTRVQLSNWRHAKICSNCSKPCKVY